MQVLFLMLISDTFPSHTHTPNPVTLLRQEEIKSVVWEELRVVLVRVHLPPNSRKISACIGSRNCVKYSPYLRMGWMQKLSQHSLLWPVRGRLGMGKSTGIPLPTNKECFPEKETVFMGSWATGIKYSHA